MKETRIIMGMPVTVEIPNGAGGAAAVHAVADAVFDYFRSVDEKFSTYKTTSEISAINRRDLSPEDASEEMKQVLKLSEETKKKTKGYFDIVTPAGTLDPSGLVKGWAIWNAAQILLAKGFSDFYVDAGGDIQPHGRNAEGKKWRIGIKNPWNEAEHVKVIQASGQGVATSGTYIRGPHIYDPKNGRRPAEEIVSLTVVGPNIYEADRFATAAFAMGKKGLLFIERLAGFEAYMIGHDKIATMTRGFSHYVVE